MDSFYNDDMNLLDNDPNKKDEPFIGTALFGLNRQEVYDYIQTISQEYENKRNAMNQCIYEQKKHIKELEMKNLELQKEPYFQDKNLEIVQKDLNNAEEKIVSLQELVMQLQEKVKYQEEQLNNKNKELDGKKEEFFDRDRQINSLQELNKNLNEDNNRLKKEAYTAKNELQNFKILTANNLKISDETSKRIEEKKISFEHEIHDLKNKLAVMDDHLEDVLGEVYQSLDSISSSLEKTEQGFKEAQDTLLKNNVETLNTINTEKESIEQPITSEKADIGIEKIEPADLQEFPKSISGEAFMPSYSASGVNIPDLSDDISETGITEDDTDKLFSNLVIQKLLEKLK